jgi:hypothetical protein
MPPFFKDAAGRWRGREVAQWQKRTCKEAVKEGSAGATSHRARMTREPSKEGNSSRLIHPACC